MFGGIGLNLVNPQIIRYFIDTAKAGGATRNLIIAGCIFLAIGFVRQLVILVSSYLGQDVGWRATNQMREDLADHCLNLDMSFHHEYTPGEMVERVDGDTTALSNFFSEFVLQVIGSFIFLIGVLILVAREDWRIGVALTVFVIIAVWVYNLTRNIAVPLYAAEREGYSRLFGFLEERLIGIEDFRTNGGVGYTMDRFYDVNRDVYGRAVKAHVMGEVLRMISGVLFALGNALAMGMGIYLYQRGVFTIGTVFLVFQYTAMLRRPLYMINRQINELQRATAGLKRIEALYRRTTKIADGTEDLPGSDALGIDFERVRFSYTGDEVVLKDVSFQLSPGKSLGLLGRTGSGKTTITRLLFRLYEVNQGQIRVGGKPIEKIQLEALRSQIGMVTQDVQLFNATVRENLTLFDATIPDDQILSVVEELELSDWYRGLPNGLDTMLEDTGLSAGEAQLLAFARVFLKDPRLVILDEPSSRLDPATEQRIDRAVQRLLRGRTSIIIAHRLGTVQQVDDIMILADGEIQEYGERQQLVRNPDSVFSGLLKTGLEEVTQ
ncbi:ABC transporter ATP-binding protein [Candidatus Poribacteria bacterium]|nr:ABC transporter ATP-binding protein [Candidatus Poribacteria bacterium]MYK20575.1 ABC transporter ATP-binding protein [Candidatus Poribacteria bacterium]